MDDAARGRAQQGGEPVGGGGGGERMTAEEKKRHAKGGKEPNYAVHIISNNNKDTPQTTYRP